MTELKSVVHSIPTQQLMIYYVAVIFLYLLFLRRVRADLLSIFILLVFNAELVRIVDPSEIGYKVMTAIVVLLGASRQKIRITSSREIITIICFVCYSIVYFYSYYRAHITMVYAIAQYYKYLIPFLLYLWCQNSTKVKLQNDYYAELFTKVIFFQVAFSVVKIVVIGFRENLVGTLSTYGGGDLAVLVTMIGCIVFWVRKNKSLEAKHWVYMLSFLIVSAASDKRAIWFLFPLFVIMINVSKLMRVRLQTIALLIVIIPMVLYVGVRLNPTLNQERKIWGSFDLGYAIDYSLDYSGVSPEKMATQRGEGRWGASLYIVSYVVRNPLKIDNMFGLARDRDGKVIWENVDVDSIGLKREITMMSHIGQSFLRDGWIGTLLLIIFSIGVIRSLPDSDVRRVFMFLYLWDLLLYTGIFQVSTLSVLAICFCSHEYRFSSKSKNEYRASGVKLSPEITALVP